MNAISQTGTKKYDEKSTVRIDTITALYIANDLIDGDVCKAERKLLVENIQQYKLAVSQRDSVILLLEQKIANMEQKATLLEQKIDLKDEQITIIKKQADKKWTLGFVGGYGLAITQEPKFGAFVGVGISRTVFKF